MIDFVSATICSSKDTPNLSFCKPAAAYISGWQLYHIEGCEKLKVWNNADAGLLKIEGSLPYFLQGHNFSFCRSAYIEAVDYLQQILDVPLWDAEVTAFEFGAVMPVESKPKIYIQNHFAAAGCKLLQNEKPKDAGTFRWWEDAAEALKLYDAGRNIVLKQGLQRREAIQLAGYDPERQYLKFETHYKKASLLKQGKAVTFEDLQAPAWLQFLKENTLKQYHLLGTMRTLELPESKKDLSSTDILALAFVEDFMNTEGRPPQDAKKKLFQRINSLPDSLLSKSDKDARKRQINAIFSKLKESASSQYDLTEKLAAALAAEE